MNQCKDENFKIIFKVTKVDRSKLVEINFDDLITPLSSSDPSFQYDSSDMELIKTFQAEGENKDVEEIMHDFKTKVESNENHLLNLQVSSFGNQAKTK